MKLIYFYTSGDIHTEYIHITDSNQKFLALVIPKAWNYTVLWKHMTNLVTRELLIHAALYYLKGMKRDIRKYIANCTLCHREKAKVQSYLLKMTEILEWAFNKIAMDLVIWCETSTPGNKHILTIIDNLTGWLEAFPIPDESADTIVSMFINQYLPVHMCPRYILSDNGSEFKNQLMDQVLQQLGIDCIFSSPYHPQSNGKLEVFHKYLKPVLMKLCEKDPANWDKYINQVLASYRHLPVPSSSHVP